MANTDRLALPLLSAAQAQKEITHNEALTLIDASLQAVVVAVAPAVIPAAPVPGQGWIVGAGATGAWTGQDGALAVWTTGGWRFVIAFEGMAVWSIADTTLARRTASTWAIGTIAGRVLALDGLQVVGPRRAAITGPSAGVTVDVEARATLNAVLSALRGHGLIAA